MRRVWLFIGLAVIGMAAGVGMAAVMSMLQTREVSEVENEVRSLATISESGGRAVVTGGDLDESNPYWQFIKMNLISVDFSELLAKNSDTTGWISVAGTELDLPFVQTTNNDYYSSRDFNKRRSAAGWVFLDSRNANTLNDRNSVLYLKNGLAENFGEILYNGWLSDRSNFVIKTAATDAGSGNWQVFTVYEGEGGDDAAAQVKFSTDTEFGLFLSRRASLSQYDFNVSVSPNDKILTIIDSKGDKELVLQAKLIKKS